FGCPVGSQGGLMRRMAWLAVVALFVTAVGQAPAVAQPPTKVRSHYLTQPAVPAHPVAAANPVAPLSSPSPPASAYGFGYNADGRLIEASDPSGATAIYSWDAAGNLLGVGRQPSAAVSVTQLVPASASAGATVRIYGTGFSTTASQDSVSFNGT